MKSNLSKVIIFFSILAILTGGFFWLSGKLNFLKSDSKNLAETQKPSASELSSASAMSSPLGTALPAPKPSLSAPLPKGILLEVPFFAQAPFGEWNDPIFQNACEEAAVVMAIHWANGTSVSKEQAKSEISALTEFEDKTYGPTTDRSAADTAEMFKDYYDYQNVQARQGIDTADIKNEISKGHLLIVPINGRILKNPFYTPPGPDHHMLVIIGYDGGTDEFISNDIGTRHGEKYRYVASRLQAALQDYPTGNDLPATTGATAMIVVSK